MTLDEAREIVKEASDAWNSDSNNSNWQVYVLGAKPGDSIAIPVGTWPPDSKVAGMSIPFKFKGQVIMLNVGMVPESLVQTFFHELGHARYNSRNLEVPNEIESEAEAIKFSLESLAACREELAYREAAAVLEMSKAEPYKSAASKIANDPIWKKYSKQP